MTKIVDELQLRVADAKKHLDIVTQTFQTVQQALQTAQHTYNVWNLALQVEQRDEQLRQSKANEKQLQLPTTAPGVAPAPAPLASVTAPIASEQPADNSEALNKTEVVRTLLRQHPAGMSAVDIWKEIGAQFNHRPYLYSVLKRLRDREEIVKRRNKYCLTVLPKAEEAKEQSVVH